MKFRIRSKLVLAISILLLVLFAISAFVLISDKRKELSDDIFNNTLSFSQLTAPSIAQNYDLFLAEDSFVYFNREIIQVFEKNADIARIRVVSFAGEVLYDSIEEADQRYDGPPRLIEDDNFLKHVKIENISIKTLDGDYLALEQSGGSVEFFNLDGVLDQEGLSPGELVDYFVVPASEKYSIVYDMDYTLLNQRILDTSLRIIYLMVFGILLGLLISGFIARQFTNPIMTLVEGGKSIAKGDLSTRVKIKSNDELGLLALSFNNMARDLQASLSARVYQERIARELELAGNIQKQIIPKQIPHAPGIDIAANLWAAEEIGGDMYDFLYLNEDRLMMYLGDVTGHGVPAGIVSSIANALFFGFYLGGDLKQIMVEVNRVFVAKTMPNIFMTLCLMDWTISTQKFRYISAGHEQIVHYVASQNNTILEPSGGIAIGMIKNLQHHVKVQEVNFNIGDYVVIYSDGIPEAWQDEKTSYGMDRLVQKVNQFAQIAKTAQELQDMLLLDLKEFMGDYPQMDDVTIMVIKRTE